LTFYCWSFEFVTTFGISCLWGKKAGAFSRNAGARWLLFFDILWRKNPEFRIQKPEGGSENKAKTQKNRCWVPSPHGQNIFDYALKTLSRFKPI
jgi:hypothetical protein